MSENKINIELNEPLLADGFQYTSEDLEQLFDQDHIENDEKVLLVVEKLHKQFEGVHSIAKSLECDLTNGIEGTPHDLARRRKRYGDNKRIPRKIKTIWELFCENFEDFILKVLIAAALASLILGIINEGLAKGWIEGVSIFIAIAIIITVTTSNNYVKERQFQELQSKQDVTSARVIRDGKIITLDAEELVVGDLLTIPAGDCIPADCIVIKTISFTANESAITGEGDAKAKEVVTSENYYSKPDPFLLQNTLAETGQAVAIVCAVGTRTRSGKTERTMDIESEQTPLQLKLESIADLIGKLGGFVATMTFIALVVRMLCQVFFKDGHKLMEQENLTELLNAFIIAVTVIVVAVPEGLPLAVTISLAFSVSEMSDLGNLVRRLHASETMGGADEICTDKTGTLTQNKMTVQAFYFNDSIEIGNSFKGIMSTSAGELAQQSVIYNATAYVGEKEEQLTKIVKKTAIGNVTECGLINYLLESGVPCEQMIDNRKKSGFMVFDIPFNSSRKKATSVIQLDSGVIRVFVKGAPEIVIDICEKFHDKNGDVQNLSESKKKSVIKETVKSFADQCYRTLLVAYSDYTPQQWQSLSQQNENFRDDKDKEIVETGLTMVGIFALMDPLRPGIAEAVSKCHTAGLTVRMCTGDNIDTARAISLASNIITQKDLADPEKNQFLCMTGKEFRDEVGGIVEIKEQDGTVRQAVGNLRRFRQIKDQLRVLARSQPEDKYLLVTGLKECGSVVAVTGDGNNDAPALNKADVGFSMGIAGTEVCKNASAIVLTQDDFCSVIVAIKYGRNIYDNVRKFLQFQLTVNVAAMFIVFSGALLLSDEALTPVQMLWVNLIMDTLAALALATEPPNDEMLLRKPHSRHDKIINSVMWRNIIGHGIYQIVVLMVILFEGAKIFKIQDFNAEDQFFITKFWAEQNLDNLDLDQRAHAVKRMNPNFDFDFPTGKCTLYTMVFQSFVMMQVFNLLNARKLGEREFNVFSHFFNNYRFLIIMVGIFGAQLAIIEYGGQVVRSATLTTQQNLICILIGSFELIWGVVIKLILPARWFEWLAINEKPMNEEEVQGSFVTNMRKSFRQSVRKNVDGEKKSSNGSGPLNIN